MEHARLISIAQKVIHKFGKDRQLTFAARSIRGRAVLTLRPVQSARSNQGNTVYIYII